MTDREIQSRLGSVPVPERPEEYWNDFPAQIRCQLGNRPCPASRTAWRGPLLWTRGFALASALVFLALIQFRAAQITCATIHRHEHALHAQMAQLDAGLHRLMLNTSGAAELLADAN
jgi:hypothetical protein